MKGDERRGKKKRERQREAGEILLGSGSRGCLFSSVVDKDEKGRNLSYTPSLLVRLPSFFGLLFVISIGREIDTEMHRYKEDAREGEWRC